MTKLARSPAIVGRTRLSLLLLTIATACGGNQGGNSQNAIAYQLVAGSTIARNSASAPASEEVLSGTFQADPNAAGAIIPNEIFSLPLSRVDFHSASFSVNGVSANGLVGGISASTLTPYHIGARMTVNINGEIVDLSGEGPRDYAGATGGSTTDYPPIVRQLQLSGMGYSVTLFAMPVAAD